MIIDSCLGEMQAVSVDAIRESLVWGDPLVVGVTTQAGEQISPTSAIGLSAYWAALRAISEDLAKLPLITYRKMADGSRERAEDHPIYRVIHDSPNPAMTSIAFRETMTHWALGWGNGFAEIEWEGYGTLRALWPIHPALVDVGFDADNDSRVIYTIRDATKKREPKRLGAGSVLHVHGLGGDGYQGYSIARIGAESIGLTLAAQTTASSFFGNSMQTHGVIEAPRPLKPKQIEELRNQWDDKHVGPYQAYRPMILPMGMAWKNTGIPPEDAQFLESRQFQIEEIARWFRMPPHKLAHLLRATFSNIEQQSIEYVVDTLLPWSIRWEQEICRKLLSPEERLTVYVEHLMDGLLRGDSAARSNFYKTMFMIGAMDQNEVRRAENMNGIGPVGDIKYVPANLVPADRAATADRETTAPPPGEGEIDRELVGIDQTQAIGIMHRVFQGAAARIAKREHRAVTRAMERHARDDPALATWAQTFFADHAIVAMENLTDPALALAELTGRDRAIVLDGLKTWCRDFAIDGMEKTERRNPRALNPAEIAEDVMGVVRHAA